MTPRGSCLLVLGALWWAGCGPVEASVVQPTCPNGQSAGPLFDDLDGDGFGRGSQRGWGCPGPGEAVGDADCDDTRADVRPGGVEICNGLDDDCDPETSEAGAVRVNGARVASLEAALGQPASTLEIELCGGTHRASGVSVSAREVAIEGLGPVETVLAGDGAADALDRQLDDIRLTGVTLDGTGWWAQEVQLSASRVAGRGVLRGAEVSLDDVSLSASGNLQVSAQRDARLLRIDLEGGRLLVFAPSIQADTVDGRSTAEGTPSLELVLNESQQRGTGLALARVDMTDGDLVLVGRGRYFQGTLRRASLGVSLTGTLELVDVEVLGGGAPRDHVVVGGGTPGTLDGLSIDGFERLVVRGVGDALISVNRAELRGGAGLQVEGPGSSVRFDDVVTGDLVGPTPFSISSASVTLSRAEIDGAPTESGFFQLSGRGTRLSALNSGVGLDLYQATDRPLVTGPGWSWFGRDLSSLGCTVEDGCR